MNVCISPILMGPADPETGSHSVRVVRFGKGPDVKFHGRIVGRSSSLPGNPMWFPVMIFEQDLGGYVVSTDMPKTKGRHQRREFGCFEFDSIEDLTAWSMKCPAGLKPYVAEAIDCLT